MTVKASIVGVWATARTPKKPREAAAATPIGIADVRLELSEDVVLGVVGAELDGAGLLVDVFSGKERPDRGKVLVAGADPARSAATRARIALLAPWSAHAATEPPLGRTPADVVANALSIRSGAAPDARAARALLESYGIGSLADRAIDGVTTAELRGVELALALAMDAPALVLLSEPFTRVGAIDPGRIRARIAELAKVAPVVVTSPSVSDVRTVARDVVVLARGRLVRGGDAAAMLDGPKRAEIHVWLASRARDTLRALLDTPGVSGASWERSAAEAEEGATLEDAGLLRVQHTDMEALALAITDAVVKTEARVVSMSEVAALPRMVTR